MRSEPTRVLVTGAGGPPGIATIRAFLADPAVDPLAADTDRFAAGLYLVGEGRRWLVPAGEAGEFVPSVLQLCRDQRVNVLVPTVDEELLPLARNRDAFIDEGIELAVTTEQVLADALDRYRLATKCAGRVPTARTVLLDHELEPGSWQYPVVVKPRRGGDAHDVRLIASAKELADFPRDPAWIVQEHLPGESYSLDVLADLDSHVVAVVPRAPLRVDAGAGRTLHDDGLDDLARGVVATLGLTLVASIRCQRDSGGRPVLLEVSPRFPGALPLTVHSGVNLPRLCLDAVLGRPLPASVPHLDTAMVRYLDERFLDSAQVPVALSR